jgi:hypothetical protein
MENMVQENKQLFSEKEHDEMWQLQTIIPTKTRHHTILISTVTV